MLDDKSMPTLFIRKRAANEAIMEKSNTKKAQYTSHKSQDVQIDAALRYEKQVHATAQLQQVYSKPQCRCPSATPTEIAVAESKAHEIAFFEARKPRRRFHSNHWYHIGEYFTSQHHNLDMISMVQQDDTIVFMSYDPAFSQQLTPMR